MKIWDQMKRNLNTKTIPLAIGLLLFSICLFGQNQDDNLLRWDANRKLTVNDFLIKEGSGNVLCFAQFSMDYQVSGFDFMTKNFNKKVQNYMIKSASWIDTTQNVAQSLRFQQALFDIAEIYTRRFRKALKENRKKIAGGTGFVEELNSKIMTEISTRRMLYMEETLSGHDEEKQIEWESVIKSELLELKDFERK